MPILIKGSGGASDGFGSNAHYIYVKGELSQVNTIAYFPWPDEVKLNSMIQLSITTQNAGANKIVNIDQGLLLKLAMMSMTGATDISDTSVFEPYIKDSNGNAVYDAWGWASLGANVNSYPPALAVSADENGLTLNLKGGSLVGYANQTDYSTVLWPDTVYLWIYWID